jgi:hypothetical protein
MLTGRCEGVIGKYQQESLVLLDQGAERGLQVDLPFIKRPANDSPGQTEPSGPLKLREGVHPARSDDLQPGILSQRGGVFQVGAPLHAVPADIGVNDGPEAVPRELARQVCGFDLGCFLPAPDGSPSIPDVDPHPDLIRAKTVEGQLDEGWLLHGDGSQDHAIGAQGQRLRNCGQVTQTAA